MINVLPQNEKVNLHKEYILRLVIVYLFILSGFCFSASFLLVPAYVASQNKINTLEIQLKKYSISNPDSSSESLTKVIREINNNLEILNSGPQNSDIVGNIFSPILATRIKGIKISNLVYGISPEGKNSLQISGQAIDRVTMRAFESALKQDKHIENVSLPVPNYIIKTNIDFSITMILK